MKMQEIFECCQDRLQCHPKLILGLKKIFQSVTIDEFTAEFISYLKHSLIISHRYPAVERTFEFISNFVADLYPKSVENTEESQSVSSQESSEEAQNPFFRTLLEYLLQIHEAKDQAVRFRVCFLISKILRCINCETGIDDDLYERLCHSMLKRLRDKASNVRVQAVMALGRLQDPSDKSCPIIEAFLYHLAYDPIFEVRRAILSNIGASSQTLKAIIDRTRDVKDVVRRAAYLYLSERIHVKSLTISQRILLLQQGLNERLDIVRTVVETKLLPAWLKLCDGSIVKFLHSLDVQDSAEICEKALFIIFSTQSPKELVEHFTILDQKHLIPQDEISCESVFYWLSLTKHLKSQQAAIADECLDSTLPNLLDFCQYIESYILQPEQDTEKRLEHNFISHQLLSLIAELDLTDQAGRKAFQLLLLKLFEDPNIDLALVEPLVTCYGKIHLDPETCLCNLAEIISDIQQPITLVSKECSPRKKKEIEIMIAKISVELNCLRDKLDECLKTEEYSRAQEVKDEIKNYENMKQDKMNLLSPSIEEVRREKDDSQTLLKCITILCEVLRQMNFKTITPIMQSMAETMLLPGIRNEDPAVRNQAILGLGLCCLLNIDIATQHFILFLQISQVDQEAIQVTALKVIFDLLLLYGLEAFQQENQESLSFDIIDVIPETPPGIDFDSDFFHKSKTGDSASNILTILFSQLNSEFQQVRTVVAEGIGKLLLHGCVYSPKLLMHLILIWYNPTTENDSHLRHFLGVFLPAFASAKKINQDCLEEAFMPTLRTLFEAPYSSPLAQIDEYNVAKFMLQLTSHNLILNKKNIEESGIHDRLAVCICNEILKEPDSRNVQVLSKILTQLDLSPHASAILKDLDTLCEDILKCDIEGRGLKPIEKFHHNVKKQMKLNSLCEQTAVEISRHQDDTSSENSSKCKSSQPQSPLIISGIDNNKLERRLFSSSESSNATITTTDSIIDADIVLENSEKEVLSPTTLLHESIEKLQISQTVSSDENFVKPETSIIMADSKSEKLQLSENPSSNETINGKTDEDLPIALRRSQRKRLKRTVYAP